MGIKQYSVGECFNDTPELLAGEGAANIDIIDCDEPRDNEVFYVAEFPGNEFNLDAIQQFAADTCLDEFDAFVGEPYASSVLDFGILYPTAETWEQADDRQVVCVIYRMDLEQVTGSLRDTRI
ncbi:MAG: septum formation family protein [Nitriliruptoraceae bacterium]